MESQATNYNQAMSLLARPFAPDEIDFAAVKGNVLAYTDARAVRRRLNLVAGADWSTKMIPVNESDLICELTVFGVTRADASGERGFSGQEIKGAASGALKRAAFSHQIGEYLYDLPSWKAHTISNREIKRFRQKYIQWLQVEGIAKFGQPLGCEELMVENDSSLLSKAPTYQELIGMIKNLVEQEALTWQEAQDLVSAHPEYPNRLDFWNAGARMEFAKVLAELMPKADALEDLEKLLA